MLGARRARLFRARLRGKGPSGISTALCMWFALSLPMRRWRRRRPRCHFVCWPRVERGGIHFLLAARHRKPHINIAVTNKAGRTAGHFSIGVMDLPPVARGYLVPSADFVGSHYLDRRKPSRSTRKLRELGNRCNSPRVNCPSIFEVNG
jgi:hypothetical protein